MENSMSVIRSALDNAAKWCPYHGQDFDFLGARHGVPNCESCQEPWRVVQALRILSMMEAARVTPLKMEAKRVTPLNGSLEDFVQSHVLHLVEDLGGYDRDERAVTADLSAANTVSSLIAGTGDFDVLHRPVLDIDLPCTVIPSSTPGHMHLYINKRLTWPQYKKLLHALAEVGIIEQGYFEACRRRGYTSVRLPWITKDATESRPH